MHVIVLAAGASTRFGSPKQLADIDGHAMLETVVSRAAALGEVRVTVVLGAEADAVRPSLRDSRAGVVVNSDYRDGISTSIRAGIERLPAQVAAVMILLGDQAAVTTEDLGRLVGCWKSKPECIVAAQYGDVIGVPAIFPADLLPELAALKGDRGARALISQHRQRVVTVPMPSAAIDIDTVDDLGRLHDSRSR
jgi:molybdenum cofactor cytidylyltransferase